MRLTPLQVEPDYEWLTLVVDSHTLQIRRLLAHYLEGGASTFVFTNLKENVGLADALFTFGIPRGAEVITSDRSFP